ncbi:MAG: T9SS type A sorting domain-containing protein [Ignavibacteria bacterium]|jgi:hypothetical protein
MKLKNLYVFIVISGLMASTVFSQQKMTVKPNNFKPFIINQNSNNNSQNQIGFFTYNYKDYVTTSFTNVRILSSGFNQSTVSATILPTDPTKIFAGANTDNGMGYYYSINGGISWTGGDILPGSWFFSSKPSCIYGNNSRIHFNYIDNFIVSDRSNNYGNSWMGRVIVPSTNNYDMPSNAVDINATSPYYGRIYTAWSNFDVTQPTIFFSYSADGGATYNTSIQIGQPTANHYEQGCNLQVGPSGEVYCVWATPNTTSNLEDHIAFSKSVNGGSSWSAPTNILTINGIKGTILNTGIRSHSFPSMAVDKSGGAFNGYIYICWAQKNLTPAGSDADICFSYSANNGGSWSNPVKVNSDPINNGKLQFLPRISVDQSNGKIAVIFYDTRDFIYADSCHTYMAVSTDAGTSFFNMRVSDVPQRPIPLSGYSDGYYSDYNSITGINDVFYPFWTDNRNGPAQIYTSTVILKPYISHNKLKDTENLTGPYSVNTTINTFGTDLASGEVKILWGRGSITDSIVMTNTGGNNWSQSIPGNSSAAIYNYYIKAKDVSGRVSTLPDNAPTTYFTFKTGADTERPQFFFTPFPGCPKSQWPDTVLAKITDNTGVDSAWIVWYKNSPSNGYNRFKLNLVTDDYYQGIFNSSQSQVEPLDSIFYRIFAQDNSTNHNLDSTSLNKFLIWQFYELKIGNGTSVVPYPFRTYLTDSRTDILYTASELIANGGGVSRIMGIAFNVTSASPQTMTNFNLRIKNTTQTSVTGFTSSGWTNVNSYNYTVDGTGWRYLIIHTPFIWDGTSNLLIEICYDNSSFNINSSVYATQINNMVWHQSQDLTSGSGCTDLNEGSAQTLRPNITFVMNSILAVKKNENIIPEEYTLNQNYPNPFNPTTNIKFQIPENGLVVLKVYDILGREIATLVNEKLKAGSYITQFSINQFSNNQLSSGVYFYKLTT